MSEARQVTVHVKLGDVEQTFTGNVEDVWLSLNRFFGEFLPSFEAAKRLVLSVDLERLVKDCEGLIGFSREGANLLVSKDKLTDNETLLLCFWRVMWVFDWVWLGVMVLVGRICRLGLGRVGRLRVRVLGNLLRVMWL